MYSFTRSKALDGAPGDFFMPAHAGFGNQDDDVPRASRESRALSDEAHRQNARRSAAMGYVRK